MGDGSIGTARGHLRSIQLYHTESAVSISLSDFVMSHNEISVLHKGHPRVYAPSPSAAIRDRKKAVSALTISSVSLAPAVSKAECMAS